MRVLGSSRPLARDDRRRTNEMNVIQTIEAENIAKFLETKKIPEFRPGDTLKVGVKVVEGERTRVQNYEGVCIARSNKGMGSSFTVRKISFGEGVERVFPLYSPNVESIEVVRRGAVRRAKLYYLRGRTGKSARIAERRDTRQLDAANGRADANARRRGASFRLRRARSWCVPARKQSLRTHEEGDDHHAVDDEGADRGRVIFSRDVQHAEQERADQGANDPVCAADGHDDEESHQEFHRERRIDAADDIGGKRSAQAGKPAADREGDGEDAVDIDP